MCHCGSVCHSVTPAMLGISTAGVLREARPSVGGSQAAEAAAAAAAVTVSPPTPHSGSHQSPSLSHSDCSESAAAAAAAASPGRGPVLSSSSSRLLLLLLHKQSVPVRPVCRLTQTVSDSLSLSTSAAARCHRLAHSAQAEPGPAAAPVVSTRSAPPRRTSPPTPRPRPLCSLLAPLPPVRAVHVHCTRPACWSRQVMPSGLCSSAPLPRLHPRPTGSVVRNQRSTSLPAVGPNRRGAQIIRGVARSTPTPPVCQWPAARAGQFLWTNRCHSARHHGPTLS